jgi:hypothetical protein
VSSFHVELIAEETERPAGNVNPSVFVVDAVVQRNNHISHQKGGERETKSQNWRVFRRLVLPTALILSHATNQVSGLTFKGAT